MLHKMQSSPLTSGRVLDRTSGFSHIWDRAVVAEQGRVGYLEVLRFCW